MHPPLIPPSTCSAPVVGSSPEPAAVPTGKGNAGKRRRGVVLLSVLIVVVLLSLAAYQYTDLMTKEYMIGDNTVRRAQAKAAAESGIHYVAAMLSNPDNISELLYGNPYDNPSFFRGILISQGETGKSTSRVDIVAPREDDAQGSLGPCFGVRDEAGKININALMVSDPTGAALFNLLMQLPNMTQDAANSIVFWADPAATPRTSTDGGMGAADNTYYQSLSPPYVAKNGPIDTIEELLLVYGVTAPLLFGSDLNRNGFQEPNEMTPDGTFDRGWAACLTIYSKESNVDSTLTPRFFLNGPVADPTTGVTPTLQDWFSGLTATGIDSELALFILIGRLKGFTATTSSQAMAAAQSATNTTTTTTTTTGTANKGATQQSSTPSIVAANIGSYDLSGIDLSTAKASNQITSLYDLINSSIMVQTSDNKGNQVTIYYDSPMTSDGGGIRDLFPTLYDKCTTSVDPQLLGRININTANQTVMNCLANMNLSTNANATPYLLDTDLLQIMNMRPQYNSTQPPDPIYNTPAWLITDAGITPAAVKRLEKYITTSTQVYRLQAVGYFEEGGLAVRVEAVIDTNLGYPRILYQRDLSDLGKGYSPQQN